MGWDIRISKKYKPFSAITEREKIALILWQNLVDNDADLMWAEDSPIAKDFHAIGKEWVKKERYKHQAYFDFNKKKNWAGLRFSYYEGCISVDTERQTLKRVEKMWEVAEGLKANLFKNAVRFTENKLEKLRVKHYKSGKRVKKNQSD